MGDELGVALRRRITRQLLIGVPLVCGLALFAAKGPAWLVERGEKAADECLGAAAKAHRDPSRCTTGAGFAFARLFPEVRERARDIEHRIQRRRALDAFDAVLYANPTVARRDAAAARQIADDPDRADGVFWAAHAGAFAPVAATDLGSASIDGRLEPAFAALALGDVATARKAILHGEPSGFDGATQSAALACLLGDRARGLALLRTAEIVRERRLSSPDGPLRVAAEHCGGTFETLGVDPYVVPSVAQAETVLDRLFDPEVESGRRVAIGLALLDATSIFRSSHVAAMALVASGADEPSPIALLRAIASTFRRDEMLGSIFSATPWPTRDDDAFADYVPPAWFEVAAARYAHAAQMAPAHVDAEALRVSEDEAKQPAEMLRAAADVMYEFAAGYRLRAGDRRGARQALDQWRTLRPIDVRRAPLELAIGDPAAALATLDAWQGAHHTDADTDLEAIVGLDRAFALAATGKLAEAEAVAKQLDGKSAAWLTLATAIASGAPLAGLLPEPSKKEDNADPRQLLAAILAKQPIRDVGYLDDDDRAVLPAVMVAVAHAATVAGQDPEVVLDATFAKEMPSRTIARARAEAARWRHDAANAKLWDDRADALEHLFVDDHAVVLAGIAGLW